MKVTPRSDFAQNQPAEMASSELQMRQHFRTSAASQQSSSPSGSPASRPMEQPSPSSEGKISKKQQEIEEQQAQFQPDYQDKESDVTETSHEDEAEPAQLGQTGEGSQANKQHHVGAVMGIFFKVWSLVKGKFSSQRLASFTSNSADLEPKVSKVRHSKMRRQTSDEAGQFQYFHSGSVCQPASRPIGPEDRHFRRAGSQPAPSFAGQQLDRLQVLSGEASKRATTCNGTSSTSSGVSSCTSQQSATPPQSAVRRHLSSYSLRRSTAEVPLASAKSAAGEPPRSLELAKPSGGVSGWASKIKRSATTVNQADLSTYVSRGRQRKSQQSSSKPAAKQVVAESQPPVQSTPIKRNKRPPPLPLPRSMSVSEAGRQQVPPDDEDSANDIYSTPNDSIQSVLSVAPQAVMKPAPERFANWQLQRQSSADPEHTSDRVASSHPIVKSFSTTSFSQLVRQQSVPSSSTALQQQQQACPKFGPIAESESVHQLHQEDQTTIKHNDSNPSIGAKSIGSRFFISSSSSEDSTNCTSSQAGCAGSRSSSRQNQAPPRTTMNLMQQPSVQSADLAPIQSQMAPVVVSQGVHYHQTAARPDLLGLDPHRHSQIDMLMSPLDAGNRLPLSNRFYQLPTSDCPITGYRRSPSLFEISQQRLPPARYQFHPPQSVHLSSFRPNQLAGQQVSGETANHVPNSISLHDCKLSSHLNVNQSQAQAENAADSEYRLAEMLLEFGSNPTARDQHGYSALMLAILSDNLAALRCLLEHGANPNERHGAGSSILELLCSRPATSVRLEMLKLLIDSGADVDQPIVDRQEQKARLLDQLISQHQSSGGLAFDKVPYVDQLLQSGAKLGSSTWSAAQDKPEVQLRLLRKLCQDGYFLYKKSSIEAAVYRFEYALRRLAELDHQLANRAGLPSSSQFGHPLVAEQQTIVAAARRIKYQTYLGLSRCERKRRFYKRALEFAHLAILIDSTSYEGYYSKANILKDIGEIDDALVAIEQTVRLVDRSIELTKLELRDLKRQEESVVLDGCLSIHLDPLANQPPASRAGWIESARFELSSTLDYLTEARKFVLRLRDETMADQLERNQPAPTCEASLIGAT